MSQLWRQVDDEGHLLGAQAVRRDLRAGDRRGRSTPTISLETKDPECPATWRTRTPHNPRAGQLVWLRRDRRHAFAPGSADVVKSIPLMPIHSPRRYDRSRLSCHERHAGIRVRAARGMHHWLKIRHQRATRYSTNSPGSSLPLPNADPALGDPAIVDTSNAGSGERNAAIVGKMPLLHWLDVRFARSTARSRDLGVPLNSGARDRGKPPGEATVASSPAAAAAQQRREGRLRPQWALSPLAAAAAAPPERLRTTSGWPWQRSGRQSRVRQVCLRRRSLLARTAQTPRSRRCAHGDAVTASVQPRETVHRRAHRDVVIGCDELRNRADRNALRIQVVVGARNENKIAMIEVRDAASNTSLAEMLSARQADRDFRNRRLKWAQAQTQYA